MTGQRSTVSYFHGFCCVIDQTFLVLAIETDILHLNVAGTSIIVLDTYDAVMDLLEKRSSIYSNRPHSVMIMELMGFTFALAFIDYGSFVFRCDTSFHMC